MLGLRSHLYGAERATRLNGALREAARPKEDSAAKPSRVDRADAPVVQRETAENNVGPQRPSPGPFCRLSNISHSPSKWTPTTA